MLKNTGSWLQLILILHCIFQTFQTRANQSLRIVHSWKFANFEYASESEKLKAKEKSEYIPANVAILDADYYIGSISKVSQPDPQTSKRRLFVTSPQFLNGIPATLAEVRDSKREDPLMSPFPNWEDQSQTTCNGPVSVYRIHIDKCGLLWVADSGLVDSFSVPRQACRPKLLVYDLNCKDHLIVRYGFPDGVINDKSTLNTIVVESYKSDCSDSVAYIADVTSRGLIMYDHAAAKSWRVENPYFYPFPSQAYQTINGVEFELMDGIFGLALSPAKDNPRKLYFHSLSSVRESWITTTALKDSKVREDPYKLNRHEFHHSEDIREGPSTVEVITDDGILIYPVLPKTALACWNTADPLEKQYQHIFYEDLENLQFISGLKLKNNTLLISSCKLQNYMNFKTSESDVKYRVMVIEDIDKLLAGTPCRSRSPATWQLWWNTRQGYPSHLKPPQLHPVSQHYSN